MDANFQASISSLIKDPCYLRSLSCEGLKLLTAEFRNDTVSNVSGIV